MADFNPAKCSMCPKDIHPERLMVIPWTLTCSQECSAERQKMLRQKAAARHNAKKRNPVMPTPSSDDIRQ